MKILKSTKYKIAGLMIILMAGTIACQKEKRSEAPISISYKIRSSWPHDEESFIQGLVIHEGKLYESTGQEKKSWIGIVDIKTGKPDKKVILEDQYFGEGITVLNNKIYQLTYKSKIGFVYDLRTFEKLREFTYATEGWGITHDSTNLIMSDGSDKLTFLDTTTLKPVRTLNVTDNIGAVQNLNELEYMKGFILANQWETNTVVKIDPKTGKVVGRIDLTPLAQNARMLNPKVDVLNGIAYHSSTGLLLVTGKYWPKIYALQLTN
jgi:glutaminyl-peptide cyclotransferase